MRFRLIFHLHVKKYRQMFEKLSKQRLGGTCWENEQNGHLFLYWLLQLHIFQRRFQPTLDSSQVKLLESKHVVLAISKTGKHSDLINILEGDHKTCYIESSANFVSVNVLYKHRWNLSIMKYKALFLEKEFRFENFNIVQNRQFVSFQTNRLVLRLLTCKQFDVLIQNDENLPQIYQTSQRSN